MSLNDHLSRRRFLAFGSGAIAASFANTPSQPTGGTRFTFVLVHGSWHGGWCWAEVAQILRGNGHAVFMPTLTGLGDRTHLLSRSVDLETHIQDVVSLFQFESIEHVILVGHSYAGMVITGAAEQIATRLKRLVYLDALVPQDGQSHNDIVPEVREPTLRAIKQYGAGWLIPPWTAAQLGVTEPTKARWLEERLRPQPWATWEQALHAPKSMAARVPRSFVWCTDFTLGFIAKKVRAEGWDYHELHTGHDAMVTVPADVAQVLSVCAST